MQLSRIVAFIIKRLQDLTKPKKGRKASQLLLDVMENLRIAQGSYKGRIGSLRSRLLDEEQRLKSREVETFPDGMLMSQSPVELEDVDLAMQAEISQAQILAIANLRGLLDL